MGANQGYQSRRTRNRHPEETFVTRCSRAHVAVASCAGSIGTSPLQGTSSAVHDDANYHRCIKKDPSHASKIYGLVTLLQAVNKP